MYIDIVNLLTHRTEMMLLGLIMDTYENELANLLKRSLDFIDSILKKKNCSKFS